MREAGLGPGEHAADRSLGSLDMQYALHKDSD